MGAGGSVVVPFKQREGVRGEDKYAATTFRRVELREEDLDDLFTIYMKIKDKNQYPKRVDPAAICNFFGVSKSDFVVKLFDAVDFDGNDSIDFKEFTLGLWNFLSLPSDRLPALLFYIYDPLKFKLLDLKDLKHLLEATHGVKLSPLTLSLNSVMKNALVNFKLNGIEMNKFEEMCAEAPFITKPIVELQKKLRKKIVSTEFWKNLELRRLASVRGDLLNVNYVYIVNEETEVWRKKDYELGIAKDYELDEHEIARQEILERAKQEKLAVALRVEQEKEAQKAKEEEEARRQEELRAAKHEEEVKALLENSKDTLKDDSKVGKHRLTMSKVEGRSVPLKKGVLKDFENFAVTMFMTAEGQLVPPNVPIEAVTVFEFPGEERFIFGVITDNKKKEDRIVMVNQDLARRRMRGADLARINNNFTFVGSSKLSVKLLPEQIRMRNNESILALCNNESLIPDYLHNSKYCGGDWNQELRALVIKTVGSGGCDYRESLAACRKNLKEKMHKADEIPTVTQDERVNARVNKMLAQKRNNSKKSSDSVPSKRNTINLPMKNHQISTPPHGKLPPLDALSTFSGSTVMTY